MAVLFPGRLLWLATPRTGSRATRKALLDAGGMLLAPDHAGLDDEKVQVAHRGEIVVTVIRNPYDLLVSWWLNVRTGLTFLEFLTSWDHPNLTREGRLLYHDADVELRYEDSPHIALREMVGPSYQPQISNPTQGKKPWREYYGPAELEAVAERFGDEINRAGYGSNQLNPANLPTPPARSGVER